MKALRFLWDYAYLPFFAVVAVLLAVFLARRGKSGRLWEQLLATEVAAIDAKREARNVRLQLGAEQAKQHVLDKYAQKRKSLDAQTEARVRALEDNPEQLAKTLERLTRG